MSRYEVEHRPGAVIIRGAVPVKVLDAIMRGAGLMDAPVRFGLSSPLGATVVVATDEAAVALEAEVAAKASKAGDAIDQWLAGSDTGVSSRWLLWWLTGRGGAKRVVEYPRDIEDFGRCVRMLDATGTREKLTSVVQLRGESHEAQTWRAIASRWGELEAYYRVWWSGPESEEIEAGKRANKILRDARGGKRRDRGGSPPHARA